jgi:hypothetical protein
MCKGIQFGVVLSTILFAAGAKVYAVSDPVSMTHIGDAGQTAIWRGNLAGTCSGTVDAVIVLDGHGIGGSNGAFSGADIDFILLDADGNLNTTGDQTLPLQNASTYVTAGAVRDQATSPYQPTAAHPGVLFGLNANGSVDFATATLGARDGAYNPLNLTVNGSNGWVTLGEDGSLHVAFPSVTFGSGCLYVFVGEVGENEFVCRADNVCPPPSPVPAPGVVFLGTLGVGLIGWLRRRQAI